jgi:sulfate adenylyltransferase
MAPVISTIPLEDPLVDLISPYGGRLVDLVVTGPERERLIAHATTLPSIQLSDRSLCDLELLAVGAFSPLTTFMAKGDYDGVLKDMRLADGTLWPMPITLPVAEELDVHVGHEVALRNSQNNLIAVMKVDEAYSWDPDTEARYLLGKADPRHPLVSEMAGWGPVCLSGPLSVVNLPQYADFTPLRRTPAEVRQQLQRLGRPDVVAFQTRNPLHRSHEELTKRAAQQCGGSLLIHPVVGMTKPGDVDHYTRVRTYRALVENHYDQKDTALSLLPLAMRMAGPREALWHAMIRRNYGANYFIVGRDHAGPGLDSTGKPFFGPYEAQELAEKHAEETGMKILPFKELVYLPDEDRYEERTKVAEGVKILGISGSQVRDDYLYRGRPLPEWFTRPETAKILAERHPPRHKWGFAVWFTGLSGSGKSATTSALTSLLLERGRQVTILDGDVVRTHLSKGLGFSREDRDTNIRRIGFVAAEIVRHGGIVLCAAVSPYRSTRNECRNMMEDDQFFEIFVDTPLGVCESRDIKGLYAKARRGEIKGFTGIDDPYEAPANAEITLDTTSASIEENAQRIVDLLVERGLLLG